MGIAMKPYFMRAKRKRQGGAPWYLSGGILASQCVAAWQAKGASSLGGSYVNLANPGTYNAAGAVDPDFDSATGWTFNGTSEYLTTGLTPTNGQVWSMICQFSTVTGTGGILAGCVVGGTRWFMLQPNRADAKVGYFSGSFLTVAPGLTSGNVGFAGNIGYRNGVADAGTISTAAGAFVAMFIGGQSNSGTLNSPIAGTIQALAVYSVILTPAQMQAVANAMAGLSAGPAAGTQLASMPLKKAQHGFEACNGKLYAVGGEATADTGTAKKLYEYDPDTNQWTTKADLPIAAVEHQSAIWRAVGTKLYFIGGLNSATSTLFDEVHIFDTTNNTWSTGTAKPTPVEDFGSAVVNGKIYCFGGISVVGAPSTVTNVLEIYDPVLDSWDTTKATMTDVKCLGDFGAAVNGVVYAFGGQNTMVGYPTLSPNAKVYAYNVAGDSWSTLTDIPILGCYREAEAIGTKIYVAGGVATHATSGPALQHVLEYDTVADSWAYVGWVPYRAGRAGVAALNGSLYLCGGWDGSAYHSDLWRITL